MFVSSAMFTTVKGLYMVSRTAITLQFSLLLVSLTYLVETVRSSILKSYLLTSDMAPEVMTQEYWPSALAYIRFSWRYLGTGFQKLEHLVVRSGRLVPNMEPNLLCLLH